MARILRAGKCYFDVYFQSCEATRDTNIKITLELLHKHFPMTTFTSLYITHEKNKPTDDDQTPICKHRPNVSLELFIMWWWHPNRMCTTISVTIIETQSRWNGYLTPKNIFTAICRTGPLGIILIFQSKYETVYVLGCLWINESWIVWCISIFLWELCSWDGTSVPGLEILHQTIYI